MCHKWKVTVLFLCLLPSHARQSLALNGLHQLDAKSHPIEIFAIFEQPPLQ